MTSFQDIRLIKVIHLDKEKNKKNNSAGKNKKNTKTESRKIVLDVLMEYYTGKYKLNELIKNALDKADYFESIIDERNNQLNQVNRINVDKNVTQKADDNQTTTNFMEIINNAAEEIGVENALNLTLEEGVEDIISEFKGL